MKSPEKVILELSDKSLKDGLSIREWLDYLYALRDEINDKIPTVQRDLENEKNQ